MARVNNRASPLAMPLHYQSYEFTPVLGWSISRYELFDKCKRQYYYAYYAKHAAEIPRYKITQLKNLTSAPLEIGTVVHDVIEAFLRRLQASDAAIDENRFFLFARQKAEEYFSTKTFIENYYGSLRPTPLDEALAKISACLKNFLGSPCYNWIFMKAYCKMDFLFPVDGAVYILDWKTGNKDAHKHENQLVGYAAAANNNFNIPANDIVPKIVYHYPALEELELPMQKDFSSFFEKVKRETEAMYALCNDVENNIPLAIESFPQAPSAGTCLYCNFQELCFSRKGFPAAGKEGF